MSTYSVGLRNVGSYMASGQPYLTGSSVGTGDEVKISFPYVTKNVTIKIPYAPNTATRTLKTNPGTAYVWGHNYSFAGMGRNPLLPPYGSGSVEGELDYTYSIWFKFDGIISNDWTLNLFGGGIATPGVVPWNPDGWVGTSTSKVFTVTCPSATSIEYFVGRSDINPQTLYHVEFSATETLPDVRTNWNHLVVTQHTSSTHIYLNGQFKSQTTEMIGLADTIIKGYNSGGRIPNDAYYDEEAMWNTGVTSDQVLEIYNSGEWFNPNAGTLSDNLVGWWTYGDAAIDKYAPEITSNVTYNVFSNQATGAARSGSATVMLDGHEASEEITYVAGPFTSQPRGKLRINMLSTGSKSGANITDNRHYVELQGYGDSITLPMKTKELYISAHKAQVTFEVTAELTNIPTDSMYALTGSGIDD